MIQSYLFFLSLLFSPFLGCKSDADKTLDKFKEINESLKEETLPSNIELRNRILSHKNVNPEIALIADSLFQTSENVGNLIDSIIEVIERADSSEMRTDLGSKHLVNTDVGDRITEQTYLTYQYSIKGLIDKSKSHLIERRFIKYRELGTHNFNRIYFDKAASIVVLTILRGLQKDCKEATRLSLIDLAEHSK